jgi:tetratricopeptide (TPR) repeat protein
VSRWLIITVSIVAASSLTAQNPTLPVIPEPPLALLPEEARPQAKQVYDEALENPKDASANAKLGMFLHAYNFDAEAAVCFRRAHMLAPSSFDWVYYLGLVQAGHGEFAEAAATLRQAVHQNPKYLPAQLRLGEYLLAAGKWQEAAQFYETMIAKHADRAEAYYGLGRVKAVRNDLNGAADLFRKACNLFTNFGAAHYGLAQVYKRLGKMDLALEQIALYEKSGTLAPDLPDELLDHVRALSTNTYDQLSSGLKLAKEGRLEEAVSVLEKALEKNARLAEAHVKLIAIYGQLRQPLKAEGHFQAAVRLEPQNPESYFNRGLVLASQEEFVEAESSFRKVLEINPQYLAAQLNVGSMLEAQGKPSDAMVEYKKVLDKNPEDAQAHFSLGRILVNQEDYKAGIEHLLKSINVGDENNQPTYLYALGAAYARSGDIVNALFHLRAARKKAVALGQSQLVQSIDTDLQALETPGSQN